MRSVTASDGQQIAIHELGGSGRPTLLCHATGLHGAVWEPLAASLGPGLERWALDFRAHGASTTAPDQPLDWPVFIEDVLAAVDGLDLEPGTILGVGHSMGGAGLVLAERARPGTFAGLWLFEPVVPPPGAMPTRGDGPNALAEGAARRRASFPSHADALANYAAKPPLHHLRADALHAYVRHGFVAGEDGAVHLACRPADESRIFGGGGAHDAFAALPGISCPVVIGTGGTPGPGMFAPAVVEALPHGRLESFPHLGHFGPLESPAEIAAAIRAFAATL
jgi:pimeloyl-ACP methyl ester carboxylesterase